MDFPLDMHKNAFKASVEGLCAGDQGKFWEMSHKLFENLSALEPDKLGKYAESVGLNMTAFTACLDSGKHDAAIKARMTEGQSKAGITGTPAFLLGYIMPDGKVKAVKKISGAVPFSNFKTAIDELLSKK